MKNFKKVKWEEIFACFILAVLFLIMMIYNPMFTKDVAMIDAILVLTVFVPVSLLLSGVYLFLQKDVSWSAKIREFWFPAYFVFLWFACMGYHSGDGLIFNIILPDRVLIYLVVEAVMTVCITLLFIGVVKRVMADINKS